MLKILSSIFYLWIINAFFSSLFTPKDHSPKIRWGIWVLFYLSHFFILSNVKQAIWNFIIGYMLIFILCILLYKGSYKRMTFFYCHFQNTYVHKLHPTADFLFKSTKASSHHGYGLYSIQKTVTKYDGICKIFTEHEVFDLKILLYLPKPTSS